MRSLHSYGLVHQDSYEAELERIIGFAALGLGDMMQGTIVPPTGNPGATAAAINAVLADGGVCRLLPGDYEIDRPLIVPSRAALIGAGPHQTHIKITPGSNADGIQTLGWDTQVNSGNWAVDDGVVYGFLLSGFTLDGQAGYVDSGLNGVIGEGTGQTGMWGAKLYGKGYWIRDVVITQCNNGLWTECGGFDSPSFDDFAIERPEPNVDRLIIGYCGSGWRHRGPADFEAGTIILGRCNYGYTMSCEGGTASPYKGGISCKAVHTYGGHGGVLVDTSAFVEFGLMTLDFQDPSLRVTGNVERLSIREIKNQNPGERAEDRNAYPSNRGTSVLIESGASDIEIHSLRVWQVNTERLDDTPRVVVDIESGVGNCRFHDVRLAGSGADGVIGVRTASPIKLRGFWATGFQGAGAAALQVLPGAGGFPSNDLIIEGTVGDSRVGLDWQDAVSRVSHSRVRLSMDEDVRWPMFGRPGVGAELDIRTYGALERYSRGTTDAGTVSYGSTGTTKAYYHNLVCAPSIERCRASFLGDPGSATAVWVSGASSHLITTNVDAAIGGSGVDVAVQADCEQRATAVTHYSDLPDVELIGFSTRRLFTDAGKTTQAVAGNAIRAISNVYTDGVLDILGTGTNDYTFAAAGHLTRSAADSVLHVPAFVSGATDDYTFAAVVRTGAAGEAIFHAALGGASRRLGLCSSASSAGNAAGTNLGFSTPDGFVSHWLATPIDLTAALVSIIATFDVATRTVACWINGSAAAVTDGTDAVWSTTDAWTLPADMFLGNTGLSGGARGISGQLRYAAMWKGILSTADRNRLIADLDAIRLATF